MSTLTDEYIKDFEANFNPEEKLLRLPAHHGGYHSTIPLGTLVHTLRESAQYGLALIKSKDSTDRKTGESVLFRIISLQETDQASPWYGNWSYFEEEPMDKMDPPDQNWRCFVGQYLFLAFVQHKDELTDELCNALEGTLKHIAYGIFRRNMQPAYSNIAAFESTLLACIANYLKDDFIKDYALKRFQQFARHTVKHGGFNEYNSPNYAIVILKALEMAHNYGRDGRIDESLDYLHHRVWELLSSYYHPVLGEITGPHSRAYSDTMIDSIREFLASRSGSSLPRHYRWDSPQRGGIELNFLQPWLCPEDLRQNFTLPVSEKIVKNTYFRGQGKEWMIVPEDPFGYQKRHTISPEGEWKITGYSAIKTDVSLGTVNRDSLWTQRRPYLAYISSKNNLSVIRIRVLKDGKDWASACLYNCQNNLNVLSVITFLRDFGDYHLFLDRQKGSDIQLSDLRIRIQVENGLSPFRETDRKGEYSIDIGDYIYSVLIPQEIKFNGQNCPVELKSENSFDYLDIKLPVINSELDLLRLEKTSLFLGSSLIKNGEAAMDMGFPVAKKQNEYTWETKEEIFRISTFDLPEYY